MQETNEDLEETRNNGNSSNNSSSNNSEKVEIIQRQDSMSKPKNDSFRVRLKEPGRSDYLNALISDTVKHLPLVTSRPHDLVTSVGPYVEFQRVNDTETDIRIMFGFRVKDTEEDVKALMQTDTDVSAIHIPQTDSNIHQWIIDPHKLVLGRRLAVGGFAEVFIGKYEGTVVAVKRLFGDHLVEDFYKEVDILLRLRHPNLLLFIGFCAVQQPQIQQSQYTYQQQYQEPQQYTEQDDQQQQQSQEKSKKTENQQEQDGYQQQREQKLEHDNQLQQQYENQQIQQQHYSSQQEQQQQPQLISQFQSENQQKEDEQQQCCEQQQENNKQLEQQYQHQQALQQHQQNSCPDIKEYSPSQSQKQQQLQQQQHQLYMQQQQQQQQFVIVTEYMSRGSLWDVLHKQQIKLPLKGKRMIALSVARAMLYLHTRNPPILHLDLKSQNILLDQQWRVKVADFGLSQIMQKKYVSRAGVGSPEWSSPEMLRGEPVDDKTDVYSYGVVLWELVMEKVPWEGVNSFRVVTGVGHQGKTLERPQFCEDEFLLGLFDKCTELEAVKRPSFGEIIEMFEELYASSQETLGLPAPQLQSSQVIQQQPVQAVSPVMNQENQVGGQEK